MGVQEATLKLTEKMAFGNRSEKLGEILESMTTPRQVQILLVLPKQAQKTPGSLERSEPPMTAEQVAAKMGLYVNTVRKDLDDLARKGIVRVSDLSAKDGFWVEHMGQMQARTLSLAASHKIFSDPDKLIKMWDDYMQGFYPMTVKHWGSAPVVRRVIPAWRSVMDNPNLQWWEDWREIFKRKKLISVRHCTCRVRVKACDRETENCLKFNDNRWADEDAALGYGRVITADEAIQMQDEASRQGLVGEVPNMKDPPFHCACCLDCCSLFEPIRRGDLKASQLFDKSRYRATIDLSKCGGCQKCIDNCQFEAISMVSVPGSKKLKAQVDFEKCFGCGCCFMVCDKSAITMECFRPDYEVPDSIPLQFNWQ